MDSTRVEPLSGFIEVNGIRLHYLDWGGQGAPIVVLHATGLLGRIYRPIAERLTNIGRVFTYDQRGHGDSDRAPDDSYDWYHTMNDLAGFITAMGWKSVLAFGHSAGATAIGSLAAEQPGLIERAVLAEPVVFESPSAPELEWRNPFIEKTLKRRRVFDSIDAMFADFANKPTFATWRKDILRDYCAFGTRPTADGRRELKCTPEVEAKYYQEAREFHGLGRILKADVPLLLMFGKNSDSLAAALPAKIAAQLRHGRVIEVPDAGHFLPMEKPEYVADETVAFLAAR